MMFKTNKSCSSLWIGVVITWMVAVAVIVILAMKRDARFPNGTRSEKHPLATTGFPGLENDSSEDLSSSANGAEAVESRNLDSASIDQYQEIITFNDGLNTNFVYVLDLSDIEKKMFDTDFKHLIIHQQYKYGHRNGFNDAAFVELDKWLQIVFKRHVLKQNQMIKAGYLDTDTVLGRVNVLEYIDFVYHAGHLHHAGFYRMVYDTKRYGANDNTEFQLTRTESNLVRGFQENHQLETFKQVIQRVKDLRKAHAPVDIGYISDFITADIKDFVTYLCVKHSSAIDNLSCGEAIVETGEKLKWKEFIKAKPYHVTVSEVSEKQKDSVLAVDAEEGMKLISICGNLEHAVEYDYYTKVGGQDKDQCSICKTKISKKCHKRWRVKK